VSTSTFAAPLLLDAHRLLDTFGLVGVLLVVFAECGLLVGFFLPGDSLLFTAGLLVASGAFRTPLAVLCALVPVAAVAGNLLGYGIGWRVGPAVFRRPRSRLLRPEYVERSREFFERYGARTIVLARFVPVVRTVAAVMAGASRMRWAGFAGYSVVGGILWGAGVPLLGYRLGGVAFVRDHLELILVGIVALSFVPIVAELLRARRQTGRSA
jgi:membrane-associated protein